MLKTNITVFCMGIRLMKGRIYTICVIKYALEKPGKGEM